MMDSKQPMVHIGLYRDGGRHMESAGKVNIYAIADEQPSTLGVPNFKQVTLGVQNFKLVLGHRSP
jgi:hypothetical protein